MKKLPINQPKVRFLELFIIYIFVFIFLGLTGIVSVYTDIPLSFFSRDPIRTLGGHPLTGIQSHLGILIWMASASICVFCYSFLQYHKHHLKSASFLLWSGIITIWLSFDDLFLFHECLPKIVPGLSQEIIYVTYGIISIAYITKFWKTILHSGYALLVTAFVFLGSSIFVDIFYSAWNSPWRIFLEDGFKLLGIVSWSSYFIRSSFRTLGNISNNEHVSL